MVLPGHLAGGYLAARAVLFLTHASFPPGQTTALLAIGQPREALAHFEEIIRLNPNAAVAHMQRGLALLDGLGRKADAAAEFETVLRLQPDFPGARAALDRARR